MLTTMRNIRRTILKNKLAALRASIPRMSADEQTRLSWAKPIRSFEDVPAIYNEIFSAYLKKGQPFPYSVLTPSYEGFLHRTNEKLISILGNAIIILERKGNSVEVQCFPMNEISYVETRNVLLDSYFKIYGLSDQGAPATSVLRFNAVTDYLFTPIVESIRPAPLNSSENPREFEKFDPWVTMNFKFMNYARRSLLKGERVVHAILQPEIRTGVFSLFGKTYTRMLSPTQVCLLTDSELILIHEEVRLRGNERYGGVWDYIPLNKIQNLSLDARENDLLLLTIHLPEYLHLECLFQTSMKGDVEGLIRNFREINTRGVL
jgi:hypothetical protein